MVDLATKLDANAVDGLRARFRGALLRPGEEGYDEGLREGMRRMRDQIKAVRLMCNQNAERPGSGETVA